MTQRRRNLFGFGSKKRKKRSQKGEYLVLDRSGVPVHTGIFSTRKQALEMAKEARREGETGLRVYRRPNPITSPRQYRLVRAAASGRARGTTMTPAAARELLRETPVSKRRKLARGVSVVSKRNTQGQMIPAKVIVGKGGKVRVFVNPRDLQKVSRRSNPTTYGTSYFASIKSAERYYRQYGYDDVKSAVAEKIRGGEIHIGKPPLKAGQKAFLIDGATRWAITEK